MDTSRVSSPLAGEELLGGRYRLGERLGSGGMASIFRANDETLERNVAVKILHAHLADDATLRDRFRTEARHAASLLHPNIVNVFDQGFEEGDGGLPYIVMEYVEGPSLRTVLTSQGRLTPGETLAVVEPLCRALARAHSVGIVHRDVKPENVLIASDGSPKVADFGIARAVAETGHTQTGALIGSVHYIAPELVEGHEATPASDQYALGVVAFELLTGRKPLPGESPMAVAARHAREEIPAPSTLVSDCSRALDKVIARATHPDPAKRYPDLGAFAAAFAEAVPDGPKPVEVSDPSGDPDRTVVIPAVSTETLVIPTQQTGSRGRKRSRRTRPRNRAGKRAGKRAERPSGSRGTAAGGRPRTRRPSKPRAESGRQRRRGRRGLVVGVFVVALVLLGASGALALWHYAISPIRTVPQLVDLNEADAAAQLEARGLELLVDARQHDFDEPAGTVLDQDPGPGAELREGNSVAVVVSAGREKVTVPQVIGMAQDEAVNLLEGDEYRLVARVDHKHSPTVEAGTVQAQEPPEGTTLEQGKTVNINVSLGVKQVTVPDLSGMDRDEAVQALEDAGLRSELASTYSDAVPTEGQVVSQSIESGAEVDEGSTVTVTISRGPASIEVPDVEGEEVSDAVAELEDAGFSSRVIEEPRPQVGPFRRGRIGYVEAQNPRPGATAERGSQIDLYTFGPDEQFEDGEGS